ncbi:hypothetical protein ACC861_37470, partial [Rhizobium ruizarguesonis]
RPSDDGGGRGGDDTGGSIERVIEMQNPHGLAEDLHRIEIAKAGIAVISLPMCNMYLQDRYPGRTPRWRGVTLLKELAAAGVATAVASDNTRDPFYAYGD